MAAVSEPMFAITAENVREYCRTNGHPYPSDDDIYELGWLMEDYLDSLIGETVRSFHNLQVDDRPSKTLEACKS